MLKNGQYGGRTQKFSTKKRLSLPLVSSPNKTRGVNLLKEKPPVQYYRSHDANWSPNNKHRGTAKNSDKPELGSQEHRKIYQELSDCITLRTELSRRLRKINKEIKQNEIRILALESKLGLKHMDERTGKMSRPLSPIQTKGNPSKGDSNTKNLLSDSMFWSDLDLKLAEDVKDFEGSSDRSISQGTVNEIDILEKDKQLILFCVPQNNRNVEEAVLLLSDWFGQLGELITCIIPDKNEIEKVDEDGNVVTGRTKGMRKWKWEFLKILDKFGGKDGSTGSILFLTEGYRFTTCKTQLWEINEVARKELLNISRLIVFDETRALENQLETLWQAKSNYLTLGYSIDFFLLDKWEGSAALWSRIETFFKTTDFRVGDQVEAKHKNATGYQKAVIRKIHRGNMEFDIDYNDSKTLQEVWGARAGIRLKCPRHDIKQRDVNPLVGLTCSQPMIFAAEHNLHVTIKYLIRWTRTGRNQDYSDVNCINEVGDTPLHIACDAGNPNVIRMLLNNRADPSIRNKKNLTCLVLAASKGFKAIVEELIAKTASLPKANKPDLSEALRMCGAKGHLTTAATLVKNKADVNTKDSGSRSALIFAAREGHHQMCKYFLALGADLEHSDKYGQTPLIWASAEGHIDVITVLLDSEANVDAEDNEGQTPLIWAASEGREEICEMLLEYGANPETVDAEYGRTPLMRAAMECNLNTIATLIEYEADLEDRDNDGKTAFILATEFANASTIFALVDLKADVNAQDKRERTALVEAAKNGKFDQVALLLNAKADVSRRDKFGWSAVMWAAKRGSVEILECLLKADAEEINSEIRGVTPLMRAAGEGHCKAVELLLTSKANYEARDRSENQTALMKAALGGHEDTVIVLLIAGADAAAQDDNQETAVTLARNRGYNNVADVLEEFKFNPVIHGISQLSETRHNTVHSVISNQSTLVLSAGKRTKSQLNSTVQIYLKGDWVGNNVRQNSIGESVISVIDQTQANLRKGKGRRPCASIGWASNSTK